MSISWAGSVDEKVRMRKCSVGSIRSITGNEAQRSRMEERRGQDEQDAFDPGPAVADGGGVAATRDEGASSGM